MIEADNKPDNRRSFLQAGSAIAAGVAAVNTLPISRAAHTFSNDEIKIGLVGCGGRGTGAAIQALDTNSDANRLRLTAVADPFTDRIQNSVDQIEKKHKNLVSVDGKVFVGIDAFKRLMDTDIDLVILATPPGFRPLHFEMAVKAGKHVFMEKPVATDAPGVRRVLEANKIAKEKKLAVAVGLQRRHESGYRATIKQLQDGAIGDIILTRAYWNMGDLWTRNRRPEQTELEYQIFNWYHFNWLSGDHICEQHIHNLDVINWLMNATPATAQGLGGRQVRTQYGQIYDHHSVEYTYPDGTKMISACRQIPGCWNEVKEYAHGSKGWCEINAGKIYNRKNEVIWTAPANEQGHAKEHVDLFASIRKGEIPNEGDYGALSTMTAIMGRMATYTGKLLKWDECINSKVLLANTDQMDSFKSEAPLHPDADGKYWVPTPGRDPELIV